MPRVTVIIPTYHWSTVLPFSIASVLRQTLADFELLVIGDGCTDDSAEVVARCTDPRVRWINLPQNTGHQSAPNNEGLRQARGDLIAYLGHDDLWLPHHLALAVQAINAGADLTYALTEMVPAHTGEPPTVEPAELEHYTPNLWIPPTSVVHRKSLTFQAGGWRRFIDVPQDPEADLWQRLHAAGARFRFIRRLTAVKFPASWRKNAYRNKKCDEQAAWSARIHAEPDFEPTELAKMLVPAFSAAPARPFRHVLSDFATDVLARAARRLRAVGLLPQPDRRALFHQRRKFKGLDGESA